MLDSLVKIAQLLFEKLADWSKSKREEVERIYSSVVVDSFNELEATHQDYTSKFSRLRDHLLVHSMPPRELITWWRNAGLEYRKNRRFLATIESESYYFLEHARSRRVFFAKEQANDFYREACLYVSAVVAYIRVTVSHFEHDSSLTEEDFQIERPNISALAEEEPAESPSLEHIAPQPSLTERKRQSRRHRRIRNPRSPPMRMTLRMSTFRYQRRRHV